MAALNRGSSSPSPSYERAPSDELLEMLRPGNFLSPLVELNERAAEGHVHDMHFRRDDEVHVYRGLTSLLSVGLKASHVEVEAHETYRSQTCAQGLVRKWQPEEGGFQEKLSDYLRDVHVEARWLEGEGAVQRDWAQVTEPWIPFDREAVLGNGEDAENFPQLEAARQALTEIYKETGRKQWAEPKLKGNKVDQLAVDYNGRLVIIELKDASKREAEVYYAPLQLLRYVWEWRDALKRNPRIWQQMQAVIEARFELGLTSELVSPHSRGIRAVVGFGSDRRSDEVKRRYKRVLDVVNAHLPPEVGPIETWALKRMPYEVGATL